MQVTRCGLSEATSVIALSYHSAGAIAEDSPELEKKTGALPGGVDPGLFRPDAIDAPVTRSLVGGPGRDPGEAERLREILDRFSDRRNSPRAGCRRSSPITRGSGRRAALSAAGFPLTRE